MMIRTVSLVLCLVLAAQAWGQAALQTIKSRMVAEILETDRDDALTAEAMVAMNEDGSWPGINYDDLSLTGYEHRIHISNLEVMALSYSDRESRFYEDDRLKTAITKALQYWCRKNYISDNWWHNIILTPQVLVTIALLMEDDLPAEVLEAMQPIISRASKDNRWARPSGDRVKICGIQAKNYVLLGDQANFEDLIEIIEGQIKLSTGHRGVQCDFSHHHRVHRVNTTVKYGLSYGRSCAEWAAYVAGTRYAFSKEKVELLVDYFLDGICKQMVYGKYSDKGVCNRDITRIETTLIAPTKALEHLLAVTDYRQAEIVEIIKLRRGELEKPTRSFCKFFWQTEHLAFQRPEFYASVRMFSTRNRNMELAHNSEGIFSHHRADGTNHLAVRGDEYLNIWPAYDWQKIPGTTVLQKPELPSQHEVLQDGLTDFVGAATDGMYGVVGFDFISPHDFIRAKKAWFFFDEEYVCLGAGIASNDFDNPVATTINQALLRGEVLVSTVSGRMKLDTGTREVEEVDWVLHDGTGYLFPTPETVSILNTTRSGRWSDINKQVSSSRELVDKDVFLLWIDHGVRPQGENLWLAPGKMDTRDVTYQYIVVPVTSAEQLDEPRPVEILSNTSRIQAVEHSGLGIVQIVFHQAGEIEVEDGRSVTLDSPGIVMLRRSETGEVQSITAADPTRKMSRLHLTLSGREITIDLPRADHAGASRTIEL